MMSKTTYLIGDIHGQLDKLAGLLYGAGLIDPDAAWSGGDAHLYFLGDYVDRGPDGLDSIELIMRLQEEAAAVGGKVEALLGNHDAMLLAAHRLGNGMPEGADLPLRLLWQQNGGRVNDLNGLTEAHIAWLSRRPALALIGDTLLQHADSTFYADYGATVAEVNTSFAVVLQSDNYWVWSNMIVEYVRRMEFDERQGGSASAAVEYLLRFGARRLVHGHTPIPMVAGSRNSPVVGPWVYADGLCVNIDGGMFLGEPGFVYELVPEQA